MNEMIAQGRGADKAEVLVERDEAAVEGTVVEGIEGKYDLSTTFGNYDAIDYYAIRTMT